MLWSLVDPSLNSSSPFPPGKIPWTSQSLGLFIYKIGYAAYNGVVSWKENALCCRCGFTPASVHKAHLGKWTKRISLLTLLNSVFDNLLVQVPGSLVNDYGYLLLQGLQEGGQSNSSWWAICLFRRLMIEMRREPSGDEH